jgi:hypothetical protein
MGHADGVHILTLSVYSPHIASDYDVGNIHSYVCIAKCDQLRYSLPFRQSATILNLNLHPQPTPSFHNR